MAAVNALQSAWDSGHISDFPQAYDQALAQWQNARNDWRAANPGTAIAADVAGSVAPAILAGPIAGAGIVGNALTGAGIGAVSNLAETPDLTSPSAAKAALLGAGTGGALGGASAPIGRAIGVGLRGIASQAGNVIYNGGAPAGLTADAADALNSTLARQGQTPTQAVAAMQALGPGAALADTGQAARELTARLAARDPNTAAAIAGNLVARTDQLTPRINQVVDAAVGPDFDATAKLAALKAATAANGKTLYGRALGGDGVVDVTPAMDEIDQQTIEPVLAGVEPDPISAALMKAKGMFAGNPPDAVPIGVAHRAQDAIDDMANNAFRAGDNAKARALWNARSALLDQMDSAIPEYSAARQQYASDKAIEEAFVDGRNILASRSDGQVFDPDLLQSRLANFSQPERAAYQLGARKAVSDVMGQARSDPAGLATKLANDGGYAASKLRTVFGDQPVQSIQDELGKQAEIRATNNIALGGSKTAMGTAADNLIPTAKEFGGLGHAGFLNTAGGAVAGNEIGRAIGHPEAGALLGAGLGISARAAAPFVNAARTASATASRSAMADALTGRPGNELVQALMKRRAMQAVPPLVEQNAAEVARTQARIGIALANNLQNDNPQRPYAKGGSVKPKHEHLVKRLMSLAESAKRAEKQRTKAILHVPDNAVTAALARANEAI